VVLPEVVRPIVSATQIQVLRSERSFVHSARSSRGNPPPPVRVVAAGEALLDPAVTRRLIGEFARLRPRRVPASSLVGELTPRETEVLMLVAEGLSNTEIAERLVVSDQTVKSHVSRLIAKLGLRDRTQAVITAYESGLVVPRSAPQQQTLSSRTDEP
jgi:DNA-binding CsgD family transcriptional regulator